jgi:hypothetical protein
MTAMSGNGQPHDSASTSLKSSPSSLRDWLPILCPYLLLASVAPLLLFGCPTPSSPTPGGTGKTSPAESGAPPKTPGPKSNVIVDGWAKPAIAMILSGEIHGYMEPCGCDANQSGGLSRRADLFKQLKDKGWSVVGLDLGGTLKNARRQSQIKFKFIHSAISELGYKALGIGPEELHLGVDSLFSLGDAAKQNVGQTQLTSSNVIFYGSRDLGVPAEIIVFEENGVKVGVISVLGDSYKKEILPAGASNDLLSIESMKDSLGSAIEKLKAEKPQLTVFLSHARPAETKQLLETFPNTFNVAMTAGGIEDPYKDPEIIGGTMVVEVGQKGKKVGVVAYYPEAEQKLKFERIQLDNKRFSKTKAMEDAMRYYQERLKEEAIAETEPAISHPSGTTFVGSQSCGDCHTKAFAKWKSTKHGSKSWASLVANDRSGMPGDPITRIYDPECLACHTTGWDPQEMIRYESGYLNTTVSMHLTEQGCENCHGPGKRHDELERAFKQSGSRTEELLAERKVMHKDRANAEQQICIKCHDPENSPNFNFDKYWLEVWHPYKD